MRKMGVQKIVAVLCILAAAAATIVRGQTEETNSNSKVDDKNAVRMCTSSELQVDSVQADYTWTVVGVPKLLNAMRLMTYEAEFVTNTTDVELFDGLFGTWYFTIHKCRNSGYINFDVKLKSQKRMNYTVKVEMALTVGNTVENRSVILGENEYSSKVRKAAGPEPTDPMALMRSMAMGLMFSPNNNNSDSEMGEETPITVHRWRMGGPVYSFVDLFKSHGHGHGTGTGTGEDKAVILTYKISIVRPIILEGSSGEGEECSESPTFDEIKQAQKLKMQNPYYYYSTSGTNSYRSYSTVGPNYNRYNQNQYTTAGGWASGRGNGHYSTQAYGNGNRYYSTPSYNNNNRYYSTPAYNHYYTTPRY